MTALDGSGVHDRFGTGWMLQNGCAFSDRFVVVPVFVLQKINAARTRRLAEDNQPRRLEPHDRRDS